MAGLLVEPITGPLDAVVGVPGSKSITNRALLCAALADGASTLEGALVADDTEAMAECLRQLGASVDLDPGRTTVAGTGGRLAPGPVELQARSSGTTARFVVTVLAHGVGDYLVDGSPQLRQRPMDEAATAARLLGATVLEHGSPGRLPMTVRAGAAGTASPLRVDAATSSQFLSGLLLASQLVARAVKVEVPGPVVGRPFVAMTVEVMRHYGAVIHDERSRFETGGGGYRAADLQVEPDASAASYALAAATICGGRVTIRGLGHRSWQGDARFVDVLARMGAVVEQSDRETTVLGPAVPRGVEIDLADLPDMALTVAAIAVFADSPTRVTGVGFIRGHETDRIAAAVTELRRCGIDAAEEDDGFVVRPGPPRPTRIETYGDHRMAMSFALLGLRAGGIEISDPGCVAKTFPGYWSLLDVLRASAGRVPRS